MLPTLLSAWLCQREINHGITQCDTVFGDLSRAVNQTLQTEPLPNRQKVKKCLDNLIRKCDLPWRVRCLKVGSLPDTRDIIKYKGIKTSLCFEGKFRNGQISQLINHVHPWNGGINNPHKMNRRILGQLIQRGVPRPATTPHRKRKGPNDSGYKFKNLNTSHERLKQWNQQRWNDVVPDSSLLKRK